MGIELRWSNSDSRQGPLFVINDPLLDRMAPAIQVLEQKSGVCLDPYGTTKIAPSHAAILADALESTVGEKVTALVEVLRQAVDAGRWLIADGD